MDEWLSKIDLVCKKFLQDVGSCNLIHDAGDRKASFTLIFGFQTSRLHFLPVACQELDFGMEYQRAQFVTLSHI
jgi:hypothetical protein